MWRSARTRTSPTPSRSRSLTQVPRDERRIDDLFAPRRTSALAAPRLVRHVVPLDELDDLRVLPLSHVSTGDPVSGLRPQAVVVDHGVRPLPPAGAAIDAEDGIEPGRPPCGAGAVPEQ